MPAAPPRPVRIHIVSRLTAPVMGFVLPTVRGFDAAGDRQHLVVGDDAVTRIALGQFPETIVVRHFAGSPGSPVRSLAMLQQMARIVGEPVAADAVADVARVTLHVHGVHAAVAGALFVQRHRVEAVHFVPHGSRVLQMHPWLHRAFLRAVRRVHRQVPFHAVANQAGEAGMLVHCFGMQSSALVECPVDVELFGLKRQPATRMLVLGGGNGEALTGAERFAQLAVLLRMAGAPVDFEWYGNTDGDDAERLRAAEVHRPSPTALVPPNEALARASIHVACAPERGFPLALARAMAAGLPCVAWDGPSHRDLLADGRTGLFCDDERSLVEATARLIDSAELRAGLGHAARREASRRFGGDALGRRPTTSPSGAVPTVARAAHRSALPVE